MPELCPFEERELFFFLGTQRSFLFLSLLPFFNLVIQYFSDHSQSALHGGPNAAEKLVALRRQIPMWHIKGTYKYYLFLQVGERG